MTLAEFAVQGPVRAPLIILECIFTIICLELGMIFFLKGRGQTGQVKTTQEFGFSALFFGLTSYMISFIIGSYYVPSGIIIPILSWPSELLMTFLSVIGYGSLLIGIQLFVYFIERYNKYLVFKGFFSACILILEVCSVIFLVFNLQLANLFIFILWPFFGLFFSIYILDFVRRADKKEKRTGDLLKYLPAIYLLSTGILISTTMAIGLFGLGLRLVGAILNLNGIAVLFYFLLRLQTFAEYEWRDKIEEIYVMNPHGICLFHKSFVEGIKMDQQIVGGAITSINMMLKTMAPAKGKGISSIEKKGKIVNIYASDLITGVLFSKEKMNVITHNLKEFIEKIEIVYKNVLLNWDGDIEIFDPVEKIVDEQFL